MWACRAVGDGWRARCNGVNTGSVKSAGSQLNAAGSRTGIEARGGGWRSAAGASAQRIAGGSRGSSGRVAVGSRAARDDCSRASSASANASA